MLDAIMPDDIEPVKVGPGCFRRDLPTADGARVWIVDMEPGAQWPYEDIHDEHGEQLLVVSGELIEGDQMFAVGTYVLYSPNSRHRPRTEIGVRLFGFNLAAS
jgi:hypothetical protein